MGKRNKRRSQPQRVIDVKCNTPQDAALVDVGYAADLLVRDGECPSRFETVVQAPRAVLRQTIQDPLTSQAFVQDTLRILWPRMLQQLGPLRCNGSPQSCTASATGFCSSPMFYNHNDPPIIHDILAIPVCGRSECQLRAKQTSDLLIGRELGNIRQRRCKNCEKSEVTENREFSACSKCNATYYCSKECQAEDWSTHKKICQNGGGVDRRLKQQRGKMVGLGGLVTAAVAIYYLGWGGLVTAAVVIYYAVNRP